MTVTDHLGSPLGPDWNPEGLVEYLRAGWQLGDPDDFVAHFHPVFHPQVISLQPLGPQRVGVDALESQFRQIFKLLPGVTAAIRSWGAHEPNVYIEFELQGPLTLRTCDKFTVSDGLITERSVFFDSIVLLGYLIRHPGRWPAALGWRRPASRAGVLGAPETLGSHRVVE
jgi:hypothetical protein